MQPLTSDYAALTRSARIWAARYGAAEDSEDVAQEALIKLWRREAAGATWATPAMLYRYLHLCVRTVIIDTVRTAQTQRRPPVVGPPSPHLIGGNAEHDALACLELSEALAALRTMGRRGRATLLVAMGMRPEEVGPMVGLAPRSVYQDVYLAREALKEGRHEHR